MLVGGDYIDGGDGDDCIVLQGPGDRIVLGGNGNDRTITVPAGTSDATIEDIFAHCGDTAYIAKLTGSAPQPPAAPKGFVQQPVRPGLIFNASIDPGSIAILVGALIAIAFVVSRLART
jgi:hypothetical protein